MVLDDPKVSGQHCRLIWSEDGWWIEDLGSTNGTFVGGVRVTKQPLSLEDSVSLGRHRLRLSSEAIVASPARPASSRAEAISWPLNEDLVIGKGTETALGQTLAWPAGLRVALEVVTGSDAGRVYRVATGSIEIGREQGDVPLEDTEVSRRHAMLECFAPGVLFVRDLGSTNGTYLNGRSIRVARVTSGDTIGVGGTVLRLACRVK
jgi:pSer/pThr/pTyr-binding forkhead associated (FHA) protein